MLTYVVFDDVTGREPGHVGERLEARGSQLRYVDRMDLPAFSSLAEPGLILILGSHLSAHDPSNAGLVDAEVRFALDALDAGVPIMAICYGAQLLARALGGTSFRNAAPEVGWKHVDSANDDLCPSGPWAQLHSDAFNAPPTATVIGTSPAGQQAYIDQSRAARAIAWQFHPEVPTAIFERWIDEDADYYRRFGADTEALKAQTRRREPEARAAAHLLVDSALDWLTSSATA